MRREDKRDEALGALLRRAAETAAEASGKAWSGEAPGLGAAHSEGAAPIRIDVPTPAVRRHPRFNPRRLGARIAGTAALAAGLAAAFIVPALVRRRADRELLGSAAEHLSRSLIRESSSFLAELPAASELEAAAADWAGSFFPADTGL